MTQKIALAEATATPFFQLALDLGTKKSPPKLRIVGESVSEVGMALGAALILEGSAPAVAGGVVLLTACLAARRKMKERR